MPLTADQRAALRGRHGADAIMELKGVYGFLSSFHRQPVTLAGVVYPTAEHAFQAQKSTDAGERRAVAAVATPSAAKSKGRTLINGPHATHGWFSGMRDEAMTEVIAAKFAPGSDLARKLLATGTRKLVEGNSWGDDFWGDTGQVEAVDESNKLGELLMQRREELRGMSATAAAAAKVQPKQAAGAAAAKRPADQAEAPGAHKVKRARAAASAEAPTPRKAKQARAADDVIDLTDA